MTIKIPVHSFVNLITNSSSETFIEATDSTLTAARELVNNILLSSGITTKKADDLFKFELDGSDLNVTALNPSDPASVAAARTLSDLTGTFYIGQ